MAVVINQAIEVEVNKHEGQNHLKPLPSYFRMDAEGVVHKGRTIKDILDDMFSQFIQIPERGWQKFTVSGDFIVPEKVTKVLVMCIGAGSSTASTRGGGTLVSRYLDVTPAESIPVKVGEPQPLGKNMYNNSALEQQYVCSSFGGETLQALWRGKYTVDGVSYTFVNSSPIFPQDLDGKGMNTASAIPGSGSSSYQGTSGTGGFAVSDNVPDERIAWLEVARDLPAGKTPSGVYCYPDDTQSAGSYRGDKAGAGADYGGSAGHWSLSDPYTSNAAYGGKGLVCVFWGDDIFAPREKINPVLYQKNSAEVATPFFVVADAANLAYNNSASGFTGNTVAEAIEELSSRISGS